MQPFARIRMIVLLAAFAAGSVVHVASATSMAVKMALANAGNVDMGDCVGCGIDGDDDSSATCDIVCITSLVAKVGTDKALQLPPVVRNAIGDGVYHFAGRTGPPEPYPPRTLILS